MSLQPINIQDAGLFVHGVNIKWPSVWEVNICFTVGIMLFKTSLKPF